MKEETIHKCFRSPGILDSSMDVVSCNIGEDDPFTDIGSDADLQGLIADMRMEMGICQHVMTQKMKTGMKISFHNWDSRLKTVKDARE